MQSYSRSIACVVSCLAGTACGVTIDYATVGDPGNPANVTAWGSWGSVAESFRIARYETTNLQYAEFLNAVDAAGVNPSGVFNSLMASDSLGGIAYNAGAAAGTKYAVKAGGPAGSPVGTAYASMPVAFVSWFSAARFANWLQNGQQATAASMEHGSYALGQQTSGTLPGRSAGTGTQVVLPAREEWYKAAFYAGAGYTLWPCDSSTQPLNTVADTGRPNAANYGGGSTPTVGPIAVGSYANSTSHYGLYDMLGNVTEYSDTAGTLADATKVQVFGGSWATLPADAGMWNSQAPPVFRGTGNATGQIGFRVAVVQAVPEPTAAALVANAVVLAAWRGRRRRANPGGLSGGRWLHSPRGVGSTTSTFDHA